MLNVELGYATLHIQHSTFKIQHYNNDNTTINHEIK